MTTTCTCAICGQTFTARTSYGLCPLCCSNLALREWDRLQNAIELAEKTHTPVGLTLVQWIATISDFRGLCSFCLKMHHSHIEIIDHAKGLVYDNIAPICSACMVHRRKTFTVAEERVRAYLVDKVEHVEPIILPREELEEVL